MSDPNPASDPDLSQPATTPFRRPPARPVVFACSPALAHEGLYDFTNKSHAIIYNQATKPLADYDADKFDLKNDGIRGFNNNVSRRAEQYGWDSLLEVDSSLDGKTYDILSQYGNITMADVKEKAAVICAGRNRNAQDSHMLAAFLWESLTQNARELLDTRYGMDFRHKNNSGKKVPEGISLLYCIIMYSQGGENKAKSLTIRQELCNMGSIMRKHGSNIKDFNTEVKIKLMELERNGEAAIDVIANLFAAYSIASDAAFRRYVEFLQNQYEFKSAVTTNESLMAETDAFYSTAVTRGRWQTCDKHDEKIVALTAEFEKFKSNHKFSQPTPAQGKSKPGSNKKGGDTKRKFNKRDTPAWMSIPPPPGGPTTKVVDGKTYYYCFTHGKWGQHEDHECNLKKRQAMSSDAATVPTSNRSGLQLAQSYASIASNLE